MDAVTIISPPAGASNELLWVWIRLEVQFEVASFAAPRPRATRSRSPWPSRWALAVESVMASTSPVPKIPRPVSYFQTLVSRPLPAVPLKSAEKTFFHGAPPAAAAEGLPLAAGAEAEQPASTMSAPTPTIRKRDGLEATVRSLPSCGYRGRRSRTASP